MDFFQANINLLREFQPELARRVGKVLFPKNIKVHSARDGCPVPQIGSVSLHSNYCPREEAVRSISGFQNKNGFLNVVYGLGFGYHVLELISARRLNVTVVEPSISIFRAFLSSVDLRPFIPRTRFLVDEAPSKILSRIESTRWNVFEHRPSTRISQTYYEKLEKGRNVSNFLKSHHLRVMVVHPIYGGSLPTANFCARALEDLGHEVMSVEYDKFADGFKSLPGITKVKENANALSNQFMQFMGEIAAAKAAEFQPDLILALAQAPLTPEAIRRLKTLGVPIAFWFVEDFRTLPYWKEIVLEYDYFFTFQRNEFFEELDAMGAHNYHYLPQGCCMEIHKPLALSTIDQKFYGANLSFMGAAYYNRVQSFPQLMNHDFKIWGPGWKREGFINGNAQLWDRHISTEETVKIYNGSRINLNLHSSTYHQGINPHGDFVNPRTFEIAACSGFQIVDDRSELNELFRAGEEIVTFNTMEELKDKLDYYLKHEDERKQIAARGYVRVTKEHTISHRMQEMLLTIFPDRLEGLKQRLEGRKDPVSSLIGKAGKDTELGRYLEQFKGINDFSLGTLMDHIENGEGALSKNETLLLMVNQLTKEGA